MSAVPSAPVPDDDPPAPGAGDGDAAVARAIALDIGALLYLTPERAEQLARSGRRFAAAAAPATLRALRSDLRQWVAWCREARRPSAPARADDVAAFVEARAATWAPATLRRVVASVARVHRVLELPDPTKHEDVRNALKAAGRARARAGQGAARQALGLTEAIVDAMLAVMGDTPADRRDAALLCVARDLLARRGELVALRWDDLTPTADGGATLRIRRSKTDQEGEGAEQYISPDTLRQLRAWQAVSVGVATDGVVPDGAIFRSVHVTGRIGRSLHPAAVAVIFKRRAQAVPPAVARRLGLDPARISGHSARVGMAQDLVADGAGLPEVMQAGRWQSAAMVARYTARQAATRGAVAKWHAGRRRRRAAGDPRSEDAGAPDGTGRHRTAPDGT